MRFCVCSSVVLLGAHLAGAGAGVRGGTVCGRGYGRSSRLDVPLGIGDCFGGGIIGAGGGAEWIFIGDFVGDVGGCGGFVLIHIGVLEEGILCICLAVGDGAGLT